MHGHMNIRFTRSVPGVVSTATMQMSGLACPGREAPAD